MWQKHGISPFVFRKLAKVSLKREYSDKICQYIYIFQFGETSHHQKKRKKTLLPTLPKI
jgi:hypothetical protein